MDTIAKSVSCTEMSSWIGIGSSFSVAVVAGLKKDKMSISSHHGLKKECIIQDCVAVLVRVEDPNPVGSCDIAGFGSREHHGSGSCIKRYLNMNMIYIKID